MRTWLVVIVLASIAMPFVFRIVCVWQVPDVVLPFDVEDIIQDDIPDDENAFIAYEMISRRMKQPVPTGDNSNPTAAGTNSTASPSTEEKLQQLYAYDEQLLADYIRAGKLPRAFGPSLRTVDYWCSLDLHQEIRAIARHFSAVALTLEHLGNLDLAWECLRANLQAGIHVEHPHMFISELVGIAVRAITGDGIIHWAANPAVTAEQLRTAKGDLTVEYSRRSTALTGLKSEYLTMRNSMKRLEIVDEIWPNPGGPASSNELRIAKRVLLWFCGQPESMVRTYRQLILNNSLQLDKPLSHRSRSSDIAGITVYELDPTVSLQPGQLNYAQLQKVLGSDALFFRLNTAFVPANGQYARARLRDDARYQSLLVVLAAQQFQRVHGAFPEKLEQLVPDYLEQLPIDPMDVAGGVMNYRREPDGTALVYSVGSNGVDDHGIITATGSDLLDIGYQIKLNRPE